MAERRTYTRRRFLSTAVQAGALAAAAPLVVPGRALGFDGGVAANNRIIMAGLGIGPRGTHDLGCFMEHDDVQFVAIADPQKSRRALVVQKTEAKYGKGVKEYRDFRDMLPRPDIDIVLIATGDRWHTMASTCVAEAGKDMYCEKPSTMTIAESLALPEACNRYQRIYQAGTQRRSIANFQFATELCHTGKLGKLLKVHANTLHPATSHNWLVAEKELPIDECDWNLWLGPCPWRPYNKEYTVGHWRGFYDFHGGGILEWGAHTVDLCNWAGTDDKLVPILYEPTDSGCVCTYENGLKLVMRDQGWMGLGTCSVRYEGTEGWVETGDTGRLEFSSTQLRSEPRNYDMKGTSADTHVTNFLESVKSRKPAHSNADVVARSHIICHSAYIAWQLGRPLKLDPVKVAFIDDNEANRMRSRAIRDPWQL